MVQIKIEGNSYVILFPKAEEEKFKRGISEYMRKKATFTPDPGPDGPKKISGLETIPVAIRTEDELASLAERYWLPENTVEIAREDLLSDESSYHGCSIPIQGIYVFRKIHSDFPMGGDRKELILLMESDEKANLFSFEVDYASDLFGKMNNWNFKKPNEPPFFANHFPIWQTRKPCTMYDKAEAILMAIQRFENRFGWFRPWIEICSTFNPPED